MTDQVVVPDPELTVAEAEALQVIHPDKETRQLQDSGREKLAAAILEGGHGRRLHYDGTFPLAFLRNGERVRASTGDSGGCYLVYANGNYTRIEVGDVVERAEDGSITVHQGAGV
jgi:hypothetical protein